jgi:hypothetical protein
MVNVTCPQCFNVHFQIWDIITGNLIDVLLGRHNQACVTMADLSSNEDLLILCFATGSFLLLRLMPLPHLPYVKLQDSYRFQLDDSIHSCKLSHDAFWLALGQDNGNIIVSILGDILRRNFFFVCLSLPSHTLYNNNS